MQHSAFHLGNCDERLKNMAAPHHWGNYHRGMPTGRRVERKTSVLSQQSSQLNFTWSWCKLLSTLWQGLSSLYWTLLPHLKLPSYSALSDSQWWWWWQDSLVIDQSLIKSYRFFNLHWKVTFQKASYFKVNLGWSHSQIQIQIPEVNGAQHNPFHFIPHARVRFAHNSHIVFQNQCFSKLWSGFYYGILVLILLQLPECQGDAIEQQL